MKKAAALFLAVLVLAFVLRLAGITFESLWLDEGYQSMVDAYVRPLPDFFSIPAQPFIFQFANPGSPAELLKNFRNVDPLCPPLYLLLLNRWIAWFGGTDLALRSLSVVLSLLSLSAVYWFSYRLFGWRTALFAGLIQAFSPLDIYYAHEVRMYALVALTATVSSGSLACLLFETAAARNDVLAPAAGAVDGKPAQLVTGASAVFPRNSEMTLLCAAYVLAAWAMINSHYTGLFVFAFQVVVSSAVALVSRSWRLLGLLVLSWCAIFLLWLPWFGLFKQAAALRTESFYVARKPSLWWPFTALFLRIPANWIIFLSGKQVVAYAIPLFVSSALLLLAAAVAVFVPRQSLLDSSVPVVDNTANSKQSLPKGLVSHVVSAVKMFFDGVGATSGDRSDRLWTRSARNSAFFLWAWAIVPAGGLWFLDVLENHRVIEIQRYLIGTAPAIYMLCGVGLAAMNWRRPQVRLLFASYLLFALIQNIACCTYFYQREPWHKMAHAVEAEVPGDQLVLVSQYYNIACLDRYLKTPYRQVGISPAMGAEHLQKVLTDVSRFALVTAQEGEAIVNLVPAEYRVVKRINLEHGLHLRLYQK